MMKSETLTSDAVQKFGDDLVSDNATLLHVMDALLESAEKFDSVKMKFMLLMEKCQLRLQKLRVASYIAR